MPAMPENRGIGKHGTENTITLEDKRWYKVE